MKAGKVVRPYFWGTVGRVKQEMKAQRRPDEQPLSNDRHSR